MKIENFCCVAAELQNKLTGTTKMSQIYFYRAYEEETLDEMLTAGFFNNLQDRIKKDDVILLYYPNTNGDSQLAWVKVVSNIGGIVTIEQITSDDSELAEEVAEIQAKIPSSASSSNKLVDNSSLTTALNSKQNVLTSANAGTNITITTVGGVVKINSSGGGGGSTDWGNIGGTLSDQTDLQNALNAKQDTLVSGTNIKTINGNSLLGSGDLEIESGAGRNVGEIIESALPLTDAGLHLLDGSLLAGGGIYDDFVTYIAGLVSTYPDCFTTEANWQQSVTNYGVCGKFVYDSVNNTVRLPKYSDKIYTTDTALTAPVVGNGMSIGVTNGTQLGGLTTGADYRPAKPITSNYGKNVGTSGTSAEFTANTAIGLTTDGEKSGLIASLSNIIAPVEGYYYIVVATSTKTEIEVDIDQITVDLANKANKDVDNLSAAGKKVVANLSFPSSTYVDLTLNVSNSEYTAPANGYYYICKGAISKQFIDINNITANYRKSMLSSNDNQCLVIMPVQKNDVIKINYTATGNLEAFRFIYAEGEV